MAAVTTSYRLQGVWSTISSLAGARTGTLYGQNAGINNYTLVVGGADASVYVSTVYKTYGQNFTTEAALSGIRGEMQGTALNSVLYTFGGTSGGTPLNVAQKWSANTWSSFTNPLTIAYGGAAVIPSLKTKMYIVSGSTNTTADPCDLASQMNLAESTSSITGGGVVTNYMCSFGIQSKFYKFCGSSNGSANGAVASNRSYNDSAWATDTAPASAVTTASACFNIYQATITGGVNASSTKQTSCSYFNSVVYTAAPSIPIATNGGTAGQT